MTVEELAGCHRVETDYPGRFIGDQLAALSEQNK